MKTKILILFQICFAALLQAQDGIPIDELETAPTGASNTLIVGDKTTGERTDVQMTLIGLSEFLNDLPSDPPPIAVSLLADVIQSGQTTSTSLYTNEAPLSSQTITQYDNDLSNELSSVTGHYGKYWDASGGTLIDSTYCNTLQYRNRTYDDDGVTPVPYMYLSFCVDSAAMLTNYALSSEIDGSKWTQGSGTIYNTTDNVGIGTTSPDKKLHVVGSLRFQKTLGQDNIDIGTQNFNSLTTGGTYNFGAGTQNGYSMISGNYNFLGGIQNVYSATTSSNTFAFGTSNFKTLTTSESNFASGSQNFQFATAANYCTGVGFQNFYSKLTGNSVHALGYRNFFNNQTSTGVFAVGTQNGYNATDANNTILIGTLNGYTATTLNNSIYLGYRQGFTTGASNRLAIGMTQDAPLIYGEFDNNILKFDAAVEITGAIKDKNNDSGTSGQILSSTGTGIDWIDNFDGDYNNLTNAAWYESGGYIRRTATDVVIDKKLRFGGLGPKPYLERLSGGGLKIGQELNLSNSSSLLEVTDISDNIRFEVEEEGEIMFGDYGNGDYKSAPTDYILGADESGSIRELINMARQSNDATILADDTLAKISFYSEDLSSNASGESGSINVVNDSGVSWSGNQTYHSTRMTFNTEKSGTLGEKMRITSDGEVGIGLTTPTEKLHVSGNAKVTGDVDVGGDLFARSTSYVETPDDHFTTIIDWSTKEIVHTVIKADAAVNRASNLTLTTSYVKLDYESELFDYTDDVTESAGVLTVPSGWYKVTVSMQAIVSSAATLYVQMYADGSAVSGVKSEHDLDAGDVFVTYTFNVSATSNLDVRVKKAGGVVVVSEATVNIEQKSSTS